MEQPSPLTAPTSSNQPKTSQRWAARRSGRPILNQCLPGGSTKARSFKVSLGSCVQLPTGSSNLPVPTNIDFWHFERSGQSAFYIRIKTYAIKSALQKYHFEQLG